MHGTSRPSLARPKAARENKLATRALLNCVHSGDCKSLRKLALEMGAELSGALARDGLGNDPMQLLCGSGHLTPAQVRAVKRELAELPTLQGAAQARKAASGHLSSTMSTSTLRPESFSGGSKSVTGGGFFQESRSSTLEYTEPPRIPPARPDTATERLRPPKGRDARTAGVFTSLANTVVSERARETLCSTALYDRRLLRTEPLSKSMPALTYALRSEDLAVSAVTRRPKLLQQDGVRFKRIVPSLTSVFGSGKEAEAAYAVSVSPELLEVEHPQKLLDSFKALCDFADGVADARFMVLQTLAPASITVKARSWTRESFVGEYQRVKGARIGDRPVYKKPASSTSHLGKGKDMYIVFSEGASADEGRWMFTPFFGGSSARSARSANDTTRKGSIASVTSATSQAKSETTEMLAYAPVAPSTPDQVSVDWVFKDPASASWAPDAYVEVADSCRPRPRSLLAVPAPELRECFDQVKESLGFCWQEPDSHPAGERSHLLGLHRVGDDPYCGEGSGLRFEHMGHFKQDAGYMYMQIAAGRRLEPTLRLIFWEPTVVVLLYPEDAEQREGSKADDSEAPSVPEHHQALGAAGFRPLRKDGVNLPLLRVDPEKKASGQGGLMNKPVVGEGFVRAFPRGSAQVPIPLGPSGLPPMVFMKLHISASGSGTGTPCESLKAADGEAAFLSPWPQAPAEDNTAAVGDDAVLERTGDMGFAGFYSFRTTPADAQREVTEKQTVIESDHRFKMVVAIFHPPWLAKDPADGAAPAKPAVAPEWLQRARWAPFESRTPVVLSSGGQRCSATFLYSRDFEPGQTNIPGAGEGTVMLAFWKRVGEPRIDADGVRMVLMQHPALLACRNHLAHFIRRLRSGFGDAHARRTLVHRWQEWAELCQEETTRPVEAWLSKQRAESLGNHVGGTRQAKRAIRGHPETADESTPALAACCQALASVLGGREHVQAAVARRPDLLTLEGDTFRRTLAAVEAVVDTQLAQRVLRARPQFLTSPMVLEEFLTRLTQRHPKVASDRLQERTLANLGEWSRWLDMVYEPPEVIAEWLARLSVEERIVSCKDRLGSFGGGGTALDARAA